MECVCQILGYITPPVQSSLQSLVDPIKKHLGFLVSSTEYVKEMKSTMEKLKLTEKDVQEKKNRADANNRVVSHHVSPWLEDVKEVKEKVESIPADGIAFFDVAKRYMTGKQSYDILEKLKALKQEESQIEWLNERKSLAKVPSTSPTHSADGTQNDFHSRDLIFKRALEFLRPNNESHKMIALCGMGGIGKTTMMKQLEKVVVDSKMFDWVVKVVVGESTNVIALQEAIAESIGEGLAETVANTRAGRLHKMFEGMSQHGQKKILVMIDDVWKQIDLKDVGLASPLPNGLKVLFTSRFEDACTQMGVKKDSIITLGLLEDEEAKTLFFKHVGMVGDDPELHKIGELIVEKCCGLPIAIETIAKNLCGEIKDAWKGALFNLQRNNIQDLNRVASTVFEFSYNNLEEEDVKSIFLLSGLFPDDFDIPIEDLMIYGWGLKLFTNVFTLVEARMRANICVNKLISSNLLTRSDRIGCVKIHDLMRAFVLNYFSRVKQASITNLDNKSVQRLTKNANESYERILLKCPGMSEFPTNLNYHELALLVVMDGRMLQKFPIDIYERSEKLQVLSYEKMHIPLLPMTFKHLGELRTLCLRSCSLIEDDIYCLGDLSNLETLSFANCGIRRLPSTIGKLKKLKLLDLNGCIDLSVDDGVFEGLGGLEELYIRADEGSPTRFTNANYEELEKLSRGLFALELEIFGKKDQQTNISFNNLERFRISIGCQLDELEHAERYSIINTIEFVGEYNELLACNINEIFEKTEKLVLQVNINNLEDVSLQHSFSNLRVLHVSKCVDLKCLFTFALTRGLMKLEELKILECHVLASLVGENSDSDVIRFPKLKFISLIDLPKMTSMCDNVIEFPELVQLQLDRLPNFVSIYADSNRSEMQTLLNKKVEIPKLENLYISGMENLKQIWPAKISTTDDNTTLVLREIKVSKCDSLTNLFPSKPLPLLNNLETVEVKECVSIEVLFNMDVESVRGMGEYGSSRLKSIIVNKLYKLKELWRMGCENNSIINNFKKVESIVIHECMGFKNLFTPITTKFDLGALASYDTYSTGKEIDSVLEGEITELGDYIPPNLTYPSYFLHASPHLKRVTLDNDKRVDEKVVFEMDSESPLLLPCLDHLVLSGLKNTSHVWKCNNWSKFLHHQFPFQNLTTIYLLSCHKIKYLFSPLIAIHLPNLKSVGIGYCDGMEGVVSSRDEENTTISASSHQQNATFFPRLEHVRLWRLPLLKSIDTGDHTRRSSDQFSNNFTNTTIHHRFQSGETIGACLSFLQYPTMLQQLVIIGCERMMEVFMFSTLESLKQLKELKLERCKAMQVVVKEEECETPLKVVVFPRLKTLVLGDLPNLAAFFSGSNEFRWPLLDYVVIIGCPQMGMFTAGLSKSPKLKHIHTGFGKYSLETGFNFPETINQNTLVATSSSNPTFPEGMPWSSLHNLIECDIQYVNLGRRSIIPSNALLQLQKLQKIDLLACVRVEEVFEVALDESLSSEVQTVLQIPKLKEVKINQLYDLKYLWKSNNWMVVEFPCLTTVTIDQCDELEHVFTCSMVGSLVQLQQLEINSCKNIEVIVKMEEEEEVDAKVNENIILPCLKSLELYNLQSLKGFCLGNKSFSFPALDTLYIKECPAIAVFTNGHLSTPILQVIDEGFGMHRVTEGLNSFIKTKQQEAIKGVSSRT